MSLRQQQIAVFFGTVVVIFSIFAGGVWLIAQRLTTEATLQTAVLMARQVEIALADSLRQRPAPQGRIVQSQPSSSFWSFLGNIFPGVGSKPKTQYIPGRPASRQAEVKGLMEAFVNRSGSIEAMWVLNADGKILYSSMGHEKDEALTDPNLRSSLRRGVSTINSQRQGKSTYYDVLVPLQMPAGVEGPGGLRLWINPADWTEMLSGLWRQLTLLFALGGGVALLSAFLTTALYTRRFRLISETLRQAEAGTYQTRPQYRSQDEVGTSLDLIDRLVMKQRKTVGAPAPMQRLAYAARTLAHEVRTPLNALAIHLELLRNLPGEATARMISSKNPSARSMPASGKSIGSCANLATIPRRSPWKGNRRMYPRCWHTSLEAATAQCAPKNISLKKELAPGPWLIQGDGTRLRQCFDNLLRNAMEAQPDGGTIRVTASKNAKELVLRFADSGPGVAPEHRAELFEFGKTTKIGGSGIGLPLSQLIVESHGGTLVYEDQNGASAGASFRLTLSLEGN